jgi:hypothetical protein
LLPDAHIADEKDFEIWGRQFVNAMVSHIQIGGEYSWLKLCPEHLLQHVLLAGMHRGRCWSEEGSWQSTRILWCARQEGVCQGNSPWLIFLYISYSPSPFILFIPYCHLFSSLSTSLLVVSIYCDCYGHSHVM